MGPWFRTVSSLQYPTFFAFNELASLATGVPQARQIWLLGSSESGSDSGIQILGVQTIFWS